MSILPFFKKRAEQNIDLLLEEEKEKVSVKRGVLLVLLIPLAVVLLLIVCFVGIFLPEQGQSRKNAALTKQIEQKSQEWQKFADTASAIKQIKTNFGDYQTNAAKNEDTLAAIKSVRDVVPSQVAFCGLVIKDSGEVSLSGRSKNPRAIYQFFEVLKKKTETFSDVKLLSIGYGEEGEGEAEYQEYGGGEEGSIYKFSISVKVKSK